jgi:hypothetical protein
MKQNGDFQKEEEMLMKLCCAVREFKEKKLVTIPKSLELYSDIKPLEEVFSGTNRKDINMYIILLNLIIYIINEYPV